MNALTRWDPFKEMEDMQSRMARLFGLAPARVANGDKESMTVAEWAPLVDITEDEKEWVVKADLPEVKKEDVNVTVENGVLTITGERKFEKEEKDKKYHRIERSYGNFLRSFTLPDAADSSKVTAEFKDGVLKVHLPKGEKAKPKAVEVKVA
jgi:HSP20 family protein